MTALKNVFMLHISGFQVSVKIADIKLSRTNIQVIQATFLGYGLMAPPFDFAN